MLKEINPEYSLEGLMLEAEAPVLWCQEPGKDSDAGKDWRQKEKQAAEDGWLDSITDSKDMNLSKLLDTAKGWSPQDHKESDTT